MVELPRKPLSGGLLTADELLDVVMPRDIRSAAETILRESQGAVWSRLIVDRPDSTDHARELASGRLAANAARYHAQCALRALGDRNERQAAWHILQALMHERGTWHDPKRRERLTVVPVHGRPTTADQDARLYHAAKALMERYPGLGVADACNQVIEVEPDLGRLTTPGNLRRRFRRGRASL